MSADFISPMLQWLNTHPQSAGLATFIISAAESIAIIGTIVPGSLMMIAIGTLAGAGIIPLWETILWAILGAIVGDGISYWVGHYFKDRLHRLWPFRDNPGILEKGETFIHKYGVMGIFIGRFVGPVRALVPVVAGMLGMRPLLFTIANVTSAIGWAPAYLFPGIVLGAASLELPPDIAMHVSLVLLLFTLFILLCLWIAYKLLSLINHQIDQFWNWIWRSLKKSHYFSSITILLKHEDKHKPHGQLVLAFYFLLTTILFFCLAYYVKLEGPANITANEVLFHLFRGIRTQSLDNRMINITLLGQKQIILPVVMVVFAWLLWLKRWRVAFHALALGILATISIYVIKHLVQSPRPWGILLSGQSYSMPSGHATLAATVYMGLAFIIARSVPKKQRWMVYTPAALVVFIIGISRLYLGAHWGTDVLGGWLLSAALLILIILSYMRQPEKNINIPGISLVSVVTLLLVYTIFYYQSFPQIKIAYAQINWPTYSVSLPLWWQKDEFIPDFRVSLFGFPSQRINLQWVGSLEQIKKTLLKEGWSAPPARNWISILHRIGDIRSTEYLPLVSPQYLDKNPALTLTRQAANGEKKLLVVQLWDANRTIKEIHTPLWVGVIGIIPRTYSWLFKRHPGKIDIDPELIFPKEQQNKWQWKLITIKVKNGKKDIWQKIMLVRPR